MAAVAGHVARTVGLGTARVRRRLKINPVAERQAKFLAADNRQASPDITRILWFPNEREVRLVELSGEVPVCLEKKLYPFYFRASPEDELPLPTAVVLIRPDEIQKFKPPTGWGSWTDAWEL
jgi:hypothetical protein